MGIGTRPERKGAVRVRSSPKFHSTMASIRELLNARKQKEPPTKKLKLGQSDEGFIPLGTETQSLKRLDDHPPQKQHQRYTTQAPQQLQQPHGSHALPVWLAPGDMKSIALAEEVWKFYEYIKPTQAENLLREFVINQLTGVITALWCDATVEVFGSQASKLALPTSDIDLMIHNTDSNPAACLADPLTELFNELKLNHKSKLRFEEDVPSIRLISARVPIIKLVSAIGGIKVDIAVSVNNAPTSTRALEKYIAEFPLLPPLVLTLKQFLYQFHLHDTYSGGIGSYALTLMVISLLQLRKSTDRSAMQQGLKGQCKFTASDDAGHALIEFFELYGKLLDYRGFGISVKTSTFFDKREWGGYDSSSPDLLCIEDPADTTNDVGRNSYNIAAVRSVFHNAFVRLTSGTADIKKHYPSHNFPTLLSRIIQLDDEIIEMRGQAWATVGEVLQNEKQGEVSNAIKEEPYTTK